MQEGRSYTPRKRVRVILNNSFPVFKELELGDKGLMSLTGIVEEQNIESQSDETELVIQPIYITNAEKIEIIETGRV